MDIILYGRYTSLSYSLIMWNSQRAKIIIPQIHPLYPFPALPTGWTNWPINEFHASNLNWDKFSSVIKSTYILYPLVKVRLKHTIVSDAQIKKMLYKPRCLYPPGYDRRLNYFIATFTILVTVLDIKKKRK